MEGGHAVHEAVRAFVERRGAWTLAAGPLPSNVLDVLKLAARANDALDQWSLDLNIPPQRLGEIAGSFFENVLITPEATHYRVLGVAPNASVARIMVHYNWLMQWLRVGGHSPEMRAELAARIKSAYRDLSDTVRRAAYDAAMSEALAARLEHVIQPAKYDPRKSTAQGAQAAPGAAPAAPEAPAPSAPSAPVDEPVDEDDWHVETVVLESDEPPAPTRTLARPAPEAAPAEGHAIELPTPRPAATTQAPVRSRWPVALAGLVLLAAAGLWLTQDQWRPWLDAPRSGGEVTPPPAEVAAADGAPADDAQGLRDLATGDLHGGDEDHRSTSVYGS